MIRSLLLLFYFAAFANARLNKKDLLSKAIAKGEDAAKKIANALPNAEPKIHRQGEDEFSPKENEAYDLSDAKPKISLPEDAIFSKQNDPSWFHHHHHYHHVAHHQGQRCCNDSKLKALIDIIKKQSKLLQEIAKHRRERYVDVKITSEGCDDIGKHGGCGYAFIKVNGQERAPQKRGHNVVVLNREGCFEEARSFDTHGDRLAGNKLAAFLNKRPDNSIILISIQDDGSRTVAPAETALKRLGCEDPLKRNFRHSFACVGYKGHKNALWAKHDQRSRRKGPTHLSVKIPY